MTAMNYKLMNPLRFKDSKLWDYSSYFKKSTNHNYRFPTIKLKEVITLKRGLITIDDEVDYKRCRVQLYAKGIQLRDVAKGIEIKTKKQQVCKPNDFLVAEIDAKMGGYGIVPEYLEGAIVSNHYFLYKINEEKLSPLFLELYIKTNAFFQQVKAVGSTNYAAIRPSHVLEYDIVLPNISIQNQLINQYNQKLNQAQNTENQANELEKGIEIYFFTELGIEVSVQTNMLAGLQIVRFKDTKKWGVDNSKIKWNVKPQYPQYTIGTVCKISSGGTPSRGNPKYYNNGDIPWVKTGELNNDMIFSVEENITIEGLKNSSAKLYPVGSLIVAMYGATAGQTAKLGIEAATNQACAVLFDIKNEIILSDYLWVYLQNQVEILKSLAQGSAQPNLNAGMISNFVIQIPKLDKQKQMVDYFFKTKEQIKTLRQQAEALRKQAKEEFEQGIFI